MSSSAAPVAVDELERQLRRLAEDAERARDGVHGPAAQDGHRRQRLVGAVGANHRRQRVVQRAVAAGDAEDVDALLLELLADAIEVVDRLGRLGVAVAADEIRQPPGTPRVALVDARTRVGDEADARHERILSWAVRDAPDSAIAACGQLTPPYIRLLGHRCPQVSYMRSPNRMKGHKPPPGTRAAKCRRQPRRQ